MKQLTLFLLSLTIWSVAYPQKFSGLALTPPMGWNSWNHFACDGLNEKVIMEMADAMVESGMRDAGYQYIVLDDCWQAYRDEQGNIVADPKKFPSGMKALADYIHSRGLKFGLYSCAGRKTCQERPGSHRYEMQDARTYASWGVDYLKYDWCHHVGLDPVEQYTRMRDALYAAGRPVVFSICEWGWSQPWLWAGDVGHLWRTTLDITDCWSCRKYFGVLSGWTRILDRQVGLERYAGPDRWNDPDMLEVGNDGLTVNESRAHFSMWCMLAAPLMAGNDLRKMTPEIRAILTNKEVIAIDQDSLGRQGFKAVDEGDFEIWIKHLSGDDLAVCFLNRSQREISKTIQWAALNILTTYLMRDLWKHADLEEMQPEFSVRVPPRDVVLLRLNKK
ncbi:MAG: hypothetical protein KatS3mg031_1879 [Chitinophagales bacterium]|nr:MAG: hypothetical protein KatS3mg031_1879 [Chitinophagales bacterium]